MSKYKSSFYDNHLFNADDIKRANKISWQERLRLFFVPSRVQFSEGRAWIFKVMGGKYYFIKAEDLPSRQPTQKESDNG